MFLQSKLLWAFVFFGLTAFIQNTNAQSNTNCDCPYPVLFMHGYISNESFWQVTYNDPDFVNVWGGLTDTFHAVINANGQTDLLGNDGILGTNDDDVMVQFVNESNDLRPGCVYASDWQCFWNEDVNNPVIGKNPGDPINECGSPGLLDSDSNESAFFKQGYALSQMIDKVLAANPDKSKVIVVGHSAGGVLTREYLQRNTAPTPSGKWWVGNSHQIAKLVTVGSPHLGSNLLGSPIRPEGPSPDDVSGILKLGANNETGKDDKNNDKNQYDDIFKDPVPTPDVASECVRDLRYSYSISSCNLGFGPRQGVYLFGGDEGCIRPGFHNDDVNCDGDDGDFVQGINIDGTQIGLGDPWDGTYDNPAMPLPTDLRYTYITHDIGTTGDATVDLSRQWIYQNNIPMPLDPAAAGGYYLTDTLLGSTLHPLQGDAVDLTIRGLDEGDYPRYAFEINPNVRYAGMATVRSAQVGFTTQSNKNSDPDWFVVDNIGSNSSDTLVVIPSTGMSGRVDWFVGNPGDFASLNVVGPESATFSGGAPVELPLCNQSGAVQYYVRVIHDNVNYLSWRNPYKIELRSDATDSDIDSVPDACDVCPGFDDFLDGDSDGIPDGCDAFRISLKVFLEGCYEPSIGQMRTDLAVKNLLPLTQPYNNLLYGYAGTESLTSIPANMVDWILVDVRSGTGINSLLARQAAILYADGSVKNVNGTNLFFSVPPSGDLYIVVRHRNHTDALTAIATPRTPNMTYDFSTGTGAAYLGYQKNIGGVATLLAADISQNADIDVNDYNIWKSAPAVLDIYDQRDTNMDGTIQATDYDMWYPNRAVNAPTEVGY